MPRRFLVVWLEPDKELNPKLVERLRKRRDVSAVEIGMTSDEKADAIIALGIIQEQLLVLANEVAKEEGDQCQVHR